MKLSIVTSLYTRRVPAGILRAHHPGGGSAATVILELPFADDGSPDNQQPVRSGLAGVDARVVLVELSRNFAITTPAWRA